MRIVLIILIVSAVGCARSDDRHVRTESTVVAESASSTPLRTLPVRLPDSAGSAAYEDSVLGALPVGSSTVVTPNGDTLTTFGGVMMEADGARDYGIDHYAKNGIQYLRIARAIGRKPNGRPIWSTRARLRLPPMDSTEEIVMEGLCSINDKEDPFILGIAGFDKYSVRSPASHAWRFDLPSEALREISTAGVTCAHVTIED